MASQRHTDAELLAIYAKRYPEWHQASGPVPLCRLIVLGLALQYGMEYAGHKLGGWHVSPDKMEAQASCAKCGSVAWLTSRKLHPGQPTKITRCPKP